MFSNDVSELTKTEEYSLKRRCVNRCEQNGLDVNRMEFKRQQSSPDQNVHSDGEDKRLRRSMLAYMAQSVGQSMMVVAFNYYYVKVFLNQYHIMQEWFQLAQVLYLLWNAINDPLFAYVQDNTSWTITRTRSQSIFYCAPFYALSFVIPWFSWGTSALAVGVHLICALLFWDSMVTFVGLATCCLFTEISQDTSHRMRLVQLGNIGSLIGANSILILEFASKSLKIYYNFQLVTVLIALLSCTLMFWAGSNAQTQYDTCIKDISMETNENDISTNKGSSCWTLSCQILSQRDFLAFVFTNFFQEFHRTFLSNFMIIFCDQLVPTDVVPVWIRSIFYGSVPIMPMVVLILGVPFIDKISYFVTIRISFLWNILGGVTMLVIGPHYPWLLMAFLIIDSCITNAVFSLFGMPLSDISDQDKKRHQRSRPISSMIFGTNALIVKPAISVCPMVVLAVLNTYGYKQLTDKTITSENLDALQHAMFYMVCFCPIVFGCIQSLTWSMYTIRKKK